MAYGEQRSEQRFYLAVASTFNSKLSKMSEAAPPVEIFDSLPYYDNDLDQFPTLKEKVDQELARQPKPPATLHPRVPPPYQLFTVSSI